MREFLESGLGLRLGDYDRKRVLEGIDSGSVSVNDCDADSLFARMVHLPHTSRLQWHEFPNISLQVPADQDGVAMQCKLELLRSIGTFFTLGSQRGYLFEDSDADCVLQMDFGLFSSLEANFFETSGHKYFLSVEDDWLVNFTMEEQLHFSNRIKAEDV